MIVSVPCTGAPRDTGLDQGAAAALAVRTRLAAVGRGGSLGRAVPGEEAFVRTLVRHHPHHAERLAGIARGAGVDERRLRRLVAREALARGGQPPAARVVSWTPGPAARVIVATLGLPFFGPGLAALVERAGAPEGGRALCALAWPWHPGALAGVNEDGLAGVLVEPGPEQGGFGALLLDQCLERFAHVDAALDWCTGRPAPGRGRIVLADGSGARAVVELDPAGRARLVSSGPVQDERAPMAPGPGAGALSVLLDATTGAIRAELAGEAGSAHVRLSSLPPA